MKERPIIFNGDMVRAILYGRKTQTRRVMKPQPEPCDYVDEHGKPRGGHSWPSNIFQTMLHVEEELQNGKGDWVGLVGDACPFGDIGDRLWVRETFGDCGSRLVYRADSSDGAACSVKRWVPSIHMPRDACRLVLEITNVRVERLSDISNDDAKVEGYPAEREADGGSCDPWLWFRDLWDGIYPEQTFKDNPWVWVIEFKRVEGRV